MTKVVVTSSSGTKIGLWSYASPGIRAIEHLFELGYSPKNITVNPYDRMLNTYCQHNNIPTNYNGCDILISFYWRDKIPLYVLDKQPSINFHPSLLPKFRGCNPIPHTIIESAPLGWTWHYMTENFDDGDIILQQQVGYDETDTAHNLYYKMVSLGVKYLYKAAILALDGIEGTPQEGEPSYYGRKFPSFLDGMDSEKYRRASYFPTKHPGS